MPPARRKSAARPGKGASIASRVHKITSRQQWESILDKSGTNRVVFIQFYQSSNWTCKQMRPFFTRFSVKFRKAIFAEVDVDELDDVATAARINRIPTYQCYFQSKLVNDYCGGAPDQLNQFIKDNIQEYSPDANGPATLAIKIIAAAAALAGGLLAFKRFSGSSSAEQSDPSAQLLDVKQRIVTAQGRLRALEKANKGKQARAQRKLLEELSSQKRKLERIQGMRGSVPRSNDDNAGDRGRNPASHGSHSHRELSQRGRSSSRSRGRHHPGNKSTDPSHQKHSKTTDMDALARLRHRKARGDAMYSDEEEILESHARATYF